MEPIEETTPIQLPRPVEEKGESLGLQITRVVIINACAFLAGKLAERAFDKVVLSRKSLAEIKELHA